MDPEAIVRDPRSATHLEQRQSALDILAELDAARARNAELEAVVEALRAVAAGSVDAMRPDSGVRVPFDDEDAPALAALPPADGPAPAPPPGEDVERLREEWLHGLSDGRGRHVPLRRSWPELVKLLDALVDDDVVPAGPQPAGETEGRER